MKSVTARALFVALSLGLAMPAWSWQKDVIATTNAVDYKQGSTGKIELRGTSLMPEVRGEAEVKPRTGRTEVEANLDSLKPANSIDLTYLTYVLWSISPDGRPLNIGELVVKDGKSSIKSATPMQAFALVVTARAL